jgi:hypothetical protein
VRGIPILVMSSVNVPRIAARSLYVCSTKCTCGTQMYPSCNALVLQLLPSSNWHLLHATKGIFLAGYFWLPSDGLHTLPHTPARGAYTTAPAALRWALSWSTEPLTTTRPASM